MTKKVFIIDVKKCNGCHVCQVACKDEHAGNDWSPIAKPQPETGQFWIDLTQEVLGSVPKVRVTYRPHMCMHCDSCATMAACPVEGAMYKREDGLVIIDPVKCTGCKNCVDVCPFSAVFFNDGLNIAQKCTGCAHLLDDGWKEPRCVDACPKEAIQFVDQAEVKKETEELQVFKPELQTRHHQRVYYKNLPKKFIGGTVYDPVEKEVIIAARCVLTDNSSGQTYNAQTDNFGDFWFEDLPDGAFDLQIKQEDKTKVFSDLDTTQKDINLGDIPLV